MDGLTAGAVTQAIELVGLPVALLIAGVVLILRLGGKLLTALVDAYRDRILALEKDRDHFRARSEAAEDRTDGLCRELIDEARRSRKTADGN